MKRAEVLAKLRRAHFKTQLAKRKRDKEEREELRKQGVEPARKVPRTIENTRIRDERTVAREDVETLQDEAVDELSTYFAGKQPKILITTNTHPSKVRQPQLTTMITMCLFYFIFVDAMIYLCFSVLLECFAFRVSRVETDFSKRNCLQTTSVSAARYIEICRKSSKKEKQTLLQCCISFCMKLKTVFIKIK